ncbi:MAG: hypothetical protein JJU36_14890 [Phycisphaeraceae bacterium]|nr:hypothetical protein [Phycisphaeraceae bacterium]
MSDYRQLRDVLDVLEAGFDWHDSFIREFYLVSQRCIEKVMTPEGTALGDSGHGHTIRLPIAMAGHPSIFGVEFVFSGVDAFGIGNTDDLTFNVAAEGGTATVTFGHAEGLGRDTWITADDVKVAFTGEDALGVRLRLGHEPPVKNAVPANAVDQAWRQCGECSQAWIDRPDVTFSRCPGCGMVTQLQ